MIEIATIKEKEVANIPIPVVAQTQLGDVSWKIEDINGEYQYSLDQAGFNVMLHNLQELRRYILDQKSVINYLIPFINKHENPLPNPESKQ